MTAASKTSVVLTQDKYDGGWVSFEALRDTDAHLPSYQRSGFYTSGSWGEARMGGTRWPARYIVRDL